MDSTASVRNRDGADGSRISAKALMGIRNLELRARAVVEGFRSGLHRSPYHGFSVEFTEYRQYSPGDDLRHLDWRVYARSDRYFLKKFEDETNLRCHFVVDQSRSMDFGTLGYTKASYAATMAATLAYFLHLQGDAVGLLSFDERVREFLPARHRPGQLRHLMLALEKPAGGTATDLAAPLKRLVEIVRKRGVLVLISDFLAPIDRLEHSLGLLTAAGHEVMAFRVLDPSELQFEFTEPALFEDVESDRTQFIDPGAARAEYRRRFEAHGDQLKSVCRKLGVGYHPVRTDEPLERVLLEFLQERSRRRQPLRRRESGSRGGGV